MSVSAIPLNLLIDTVSHEALIKGQRAKTYDTPATLNHVLVQSKNIRSLVDGNYISVSGALMFWDATNSTAATFALGDKITYTDRAVGEVSRYIKEINVLVDDDTLHHLELMLL